MRLANDYQGLMRLIENNTKNMQETFARDKYSSQTSGLARKGTKTWIYHSKTLWLFTASDLKTIIVPTSTFGILTAFHAPIFGIDTTPTAAVFRVVLITTSWTWINLLPFAIDNQRQVDAIEEDRLNKPWRPLPSNRMTAQRARMVMFMLYPVAVLWSVRFDGWKQCLSLIALGYWYNDRNGARGCVTRNLINACGFVCYTSGAMELAMGTPLPNRVLLGKWFLIIGGVVFSTVQIQDLYDQAGDRVCGRRTLPLVVGDGWSRWITALPMVLWGLFCPWYWHTHVGVWMAFLAIALLIVVRMLVRREVADDKVTFKIWNAWMIFLYLLPIIQYRAS